MQPAGLTATLIAGLVLANNALWMYAHGAASRQAGHALVESQTQQCDESLRDAEQRQESAVRVASGLELAPRTPVYPDPVLRAPLPKPRQPASDPRSEPQPDDPAPTELDAEDLSAEIPFELSEDHQYARSADREAFFEDDIDDKLTTIASLAAHGSDLVLIEEILHEDHNPEVRIAALSRLTQERSFASANLLIAALDDPVEDVRLAAVDSIVAAADRTLIPVLERKLRGRAAPEQVELYQTAIHRLRYSGSMAMDELPVEQ